MSKSIKLGIYQKVFGCSNLIPRSPPAKPYFLLLECDLYCSYLQPSACRRPPARARIGRQLNDTIPCSSILVGALEVHIWLGEFVDVYFKVV